MGKLFTDEQCQLARDTDMIDLLLRYEGFHFKMVGHVYKCIEHDSLIVRDDRKHWYWNSRHVGGTNAIDYLQTIDKCDYKEAMLILVGDPNVSFTHNKSYTPTETEKKNLLCRKIFKGGIIGYLLILQNADV